MERHPRRTIGTSSIDLSQYRFMKVHCPLTSIKLNCPELDFDVFMLSFESHGLHTVNFSTHLYFCTETRLRLTSYSKWHFSFFPMTHYFSSLIEKLTHDPVSDSNYSTIMSSLLLIRYAAPFCNCSCIYLGMSSPLGP